MSFINWLNQKKNQLESDISHVATPIVHDVEHVAAPVAQAVQHVAAPVFHAANQIAQPIEHAANVFQPHYLAAPKAPTFKPIPAPTFTQPHASIFHNLTHNPLTNAIGNDVIKPVANFESRNIDQANPFDNGRTFTQRTPTNNRSVLGQATHNGLSNVVGGAVKFAPQLANTANLYAHEVPDTVRQIAAANTNNPTAFRNASAQSSQDFQHFAAPNSGVLGQGTVFKSPQEAESGNLKTGLERIGGATAQALLTAATPGIGKAVSAGVGRVGSALVPKVLADAVPSVVRTVVPKAITGSVTGAAIGAPFNAASYTQNTSNPTLQGAFQSALQGAKAGAVLGGAGDVLAHAPEVINALKKLPREQRTFNVRNASRAKGVTNVPTNSIRPVDITGYGDLDPARVEHYKQQMLQNKKLRPLLLMKGEGKELFTEDGKHRLEAAKQLGMNRVPAKIVTPREVRTKQQAGFVRVPGSAGGSASEDSVPINIPKQRLPTGRAAKTPSSASSRQVSSKNSVAPEVLNTVGSAVPKGKTARLALPKNPIQKVPTSNEVVAPDATNVEIQPSKTKTPVRNTSAGETATTTDQQSPVTSADNNTKQRGFTTSVKQSANYTKDLKKSVNSQYDVVTDKQTIANTQKYLKQGVAKAHNDVLKRLGSTEAPDKQLISDAGTVMQHLDSQGRTSEAQVIHDKLSEKLTKSGQASQAASLLLRRSPDGIYHKAVSDLKKAGVNVSPDVDKQLQKLREDIRKTTPDTTERDVAVQKMRQFVSKNIPTSIKDKAFAIWRAGLLTGPRTVAKILTSHGVQLPLEAIKDIPAAGIDRAISHITGRRSLALTRKGVGSGLKEGAQAGFGKNGYLRTGIDVQPGSNSVEFHNETNFGNSPIGKVGNAYTNGIGRLHGSLYKPFYGAVYKNSLSSQALAAAKTAGIKGSERAAFVKSFVTNPSHEAMDIAKNDAEHATFQQETALGKGASQIQKIPVVGRYIAPFTRIPSAIASDLVDYSPAGIIKTVVKGIQSARKGEGWSVADQRNFVQGLGRGITGSAALVPGYFLYKKGMLTLSYPSDDPNEQKIWATEGKTENSVLIGGKWRALGSLGPLGAVLSLGGGIASGGLVQGAGQAVKSLEDQPYVSGLTQAASALQDPGRYLSSLEKQYAGSLVPTAVAQTASVSDKLARQANTPIDTVKSKIPGLRESLAPKKNAFGQNIPNGETGVGAAIDPFYSSTNLKTDSTLKELQRLNNVGQGTMPSVQNAKNTFDGVKTNLTKSQAQQLSAQVGQAVKPLWDKTIASPEYKALTDENKHKALADVLSDTTSAVKEKYASQNKLGQYAAGFNGKPSTISTKQQSILGSSFDPTAYTLATSSGVSGSPAQKYKTALANFNMTSKNMSDVQKYSAQQNLNRLKIEVPYSSDVISLYSMSKANLNSYLTTKTTGVDKQSLYNQLVKYDNALYDAGIITSKKFKYGLGSASGGSGGSSSKFNPLEAASQFAGAIAAPKVQTYHFASAKAPSSSGAYLSAPPHKVFHPVNHVSFRKSKR